MHKQIVVWVCPAPGCTNYYGSSAEAGKDLAQEKKFSRVEDRDEKTGKRYERGMRADCPACGARRICVNAMVRVPEPSASPEAA